MNNSGLYAIENTETGRQYFGSSVDVPRRIKTHKVSLDRGVHFNDRLQDDWDKYGEIAFTFQQITAGVAHRELFADEAEKIENYSGELYNIAKVNPDQERNAYDGPPLKATSITLPEKQLEWLNEQVESSDKIRSVSQLISEIIDAYKAYHEKDNE